MQKEITPEEQFAATNWESKDSIVKLFPTYVQEQYAATVANKRNLSKQVLIEGFTMKTPFGDQVLIKNAELRIEPHTRQCLYGANSTGKTLLFTNMSEGKIKEFPKHLFLHHCKELENHELSETVIDTVVNSYPYRNMLIRCEAKLTELVAAIEAEGESADADKRANLKENLNYVQFEMRRIDGYNARERAEKMLRVLGFDETGQKKLCVALSGGLRMRVALCIAFFMEADLLLLDEPTNHLDFPSVLWLENRLRGFKGSFLLVSHDRELLNNVCHSVLLLENQTITYYTKGFKEFEKSKAAEDKKKAEDIEKFIEKNRNADPSTMLGAQKAQKKEWAEKYYAKQVALAGKFTFPKPLDLKNLEVGADGKPIPKDQISLINLQNVRFSYNVETGHFIFNDPISFNVTAGTRCGVMGPNGAGKSTLLKLLTKKLIPTEGTVTQHPEFKLAYFGQHSTAELNLEQTPIEWMQDQFPDEKAGSLRQHLGKTSIMGPTAETRMGRLSFSQRSCIIFAKLTYVCPHLLILDEPTNFLDLESVDSLIAACNKYSGALLLVSHNRDFLKKCAKQYLSVVPGHFELYDNLKTAERATYTFIAEMEEGGSVGKSALANNPGGGTIHASQKVGAAAGGVIAKAPVTATASGADGIIKPAPGQPIAPAEPIAWKAGDKCQALWTDGKWYAAVIKNVNGPKIAVTYTQYGNTTTVTADKLKKAVAAAAAPAGKAAPAAAAKAAPKGKAK